MSDFHRRLCEQTLGLVSKQLSPFLPFAKRDPSGPLRARDGPSRVTVEPRWEHSMPMRRV